MACTCQQAPLERFRVDPRARPTKGIVCGDAIRQRQKRSEPRWSAATKCRHINPTFRPADDRAHGNHDTINQVMRLGASARGSSAVAKYWVIASCSCSVVAPSAIRHERGAMMPENARNRNQEDAITLAGWGASVHVSGEFVYTANDYAADH
jgi:hypothetical protein